MFDLASIIKTVGYVGVGAIIFAESGLLIGIVLPGDSVLFTAGLLASQGYLRIVPLVIICFLAAVVGDNVGYWFGRRFGPKVFSRNNSVLLNTAHIERARRFYAKHGPKTIIIARFVPVVRTLAPMLAGVGEMNWLTFTTYNLIGGIVWGVGLTLMGFWSGNLIPNIEHYSIYIIAGIILISILPSFYPVLRNRERRYEAWAEIKKVFSRK